MRAICFVIAFLFTALSLPAHAADTPTYAVDAAWPKTLPNDWIMGQAAGVAVDGDDNIWVVQRPKTLTTDEKAAALNPPATKCCKPAPPVLVFDQQGTRDQGSCPLSRGILRRATTPLGAPGCTVSLALPP